MTTYKGRAVHSIGPNGWCFLFPICPICKVNDGFHSYGKDEDCPCFKGCRLCLKCCEVLFKFTSVSRGAKLRRQIGAHVRRVRKAHRVAYL